MLEFVAEPSGQQLAVPVAGAFGTGEQRIFRQPRLVGRLPGLVRGQPGSVGRFFRRQFVRRQFVRRRFVRQRLVRWRLVRWWFIR